VALASSRDFAPLPPPQLFVDMAVLVESQGEQQVEDAKLRVGGASLFISTNGAAVGVNGGDRSESTEAGKGWMAGTSEGGGGAQGRLGYGGRESSESDTGSLS